MSQGEFTKQEASRVLVVLEEMFDALAASKRYSFLGHLNDIALFVEAAQSAAPYETPFPKPLPVGVQTGKRSISNE